MKKGRGNPNTIYVSERLQECLHLISQSAVTTVVAPMGYGKTTAINWYLAKQQKTEQAVVVRVSIYSDNRQVFWHSVLRAFAFSGLDFLNGYDCPFDSASAGFLADVLCHSLVGKQRYYIFLDDFHLLSDEHVAEFLGILAGRLPENVHLVVASRANVFSGSAVVRLGGKLYQITAEDLRLTAGELSVYAYKCGTSLSQKQMEMLLHSSEGWFSAVYLNLCEFARSGKLPDVQSDIYAMFSNALIEPLPKEQQEFLTVMGLADEFTVEMAEAVTGKKNIAEILKELMSQNAFVKCLSDGRSYRFHHMMKSCAEQLFFVMEPEKQAVYQNRYGDWYYGHGLHLHALAAYRASGNFAALLEVIREDAGILLSSLKPEEVLTWITECPKAVLKEHPFAILVLMRSMFNWRQIPKMLELKELLMTAIAEHPEWSLEETGNLSGECDLIMSFLMYNDISQMSRLHRSASAKMTHPAISIQSQGGWTFGSPSVLMMFHREPGSLKKELEEMKECMPHYYKITNGHGQGAERIMDAEASFMQGHFTDAQIKLEGAYAQIEGNGQESIALCCDFLTQRMLLCSDMKSRMPIADRRAQLMGGHNVTWVYIYDSICSYYYAVIGQTEQIPALFREHQLSQVHFLAPGRPMLEMIENQVYLSQGSFAKVLGQGERLLVMCEGMHYGLVALHVKIQMAAAYEQLGKRLESRSLLKEAIQDAFADNFLMPFVENYRYLKELLEGVHITGHQEFVEQITELGKCYESQCAKLRNEKVRSESLNLLTEREIQMAEMIALRLSNKEIAEKLFLSEGTVKQYINQIYSKLEIKGDIRTKRAMLIEQIKDTKN